MRLIALLLTATLIGPAAAAQTAKPSSTPSAPSPDADAKAAADRDLPVSLGKIRDALERAAAPGFLLKNVQDAPTFRIEIRERQKIEELLGTLDFKAGPTPPGGVYAYEQQRVMFPAVDNPLAQPYAAFNQTELADRGGPVGGQLDGRQIRGEGPEGRLSGASAAGGARRGRPRDRRILRRQGERRRRHPAL